MSDQAKWAIATAGDDGKAQTYNEGNDSWDLTPVLTAAEVQSGFQPLDSDLTAIAALTTTAFGRALLELTDAAATRTALDVERKATIDVRDFGAVCDAVTATIGSGTDDTAAIQAAIDSVTSAVGASEVPSGVIIIPGPCRITDTLLIRRKSIHLHTAGTGMGDTAKGALIWDGAADVPMLRLDSTLGCLIEMRFVGNDTNQPSAAIEIMANSIVTQPDNQSNMIRNTHIGPDPYWGSNVGKGKVKRGVHILGTTGNDRVLMDNVEIKKPSVAGIVSTNYNSIWNQWDNVLIDGQGTQVPIAIQSAGGFQANNLNTNWCDLVLDLATGNAGPEVTLLNHQAEKCLMLLDSQLDSHVTIIGGRFLMSTVVPGSKLVDFDAMGFTGSLEMINYHWLGYTDYFDKAETPVARPYLYFNSTRAGNYVRMVGCRGLRHTDVVTAVGSLGGLRLEMVTNSAPLYDGVSPYTGVALSNNLVTGETTPRAGVHDAAVGFKVTDAAALPAAAAAYRGQIRVLSASGVEDKVCVCVRHSTSSYKWVNVTDGSTVT